MKLTEYDALEVYAKMLNRSDAKPLAGILADDFVYESQKVFQPLKTKQEFMDYIVPKLQTISRNNANVYAEMGSVFAYGEERPCVILAQYEKSNLIGLAFAKVEGDKLTRIDLCVVPSPESAERSGYYPR